MIDTTGTEPITNAEVIDSRDVIARIAYLKSAWNDATGDSHCDYALSEDDWTVGLGEEDAAELVALLALQEEAEPYAADWQYGETLIRDDYFETYARELADDIGAIDHNAGWPLTYIDWPAAARALQQDYTQVTFDTTTYWIR